MNELSEEYNKKNKKMLIRLKNLKKDSKEYIALRNEILLFNQGLIYKILELERAHYSLDNCEYDDIVQTCNICLIKAIEKYDHTYGVNFSTYAWSYIIKGIRKCMNENQIVYIPDNKMRKYCTEGNEKISNLLKQRSLEDIYQKDDILYDVDPRNIICYGEYGTDNDSSLHYDSIELKDLLKKMQDVLTPRERNLFYLYFSKEYTLEQMGKEYGLSKQRIRQIIIRALHKCRLRSIKLKLSAFL